MNRKINNYSFRVLAEDLLDELGVKKTPDNVIAVLQFMRDVVAHALSRMTR